MFIFKKIRENYSIFKKIIRNNWKVRKRAATTRFHINAKLHSNENAYIQSIFTKIKDIFSFISFLSQKLLSISITTDRYL